MEKRIVSLNGEWEYVALPAGTIDNINFDVLYGENDWQKIRVPGCWDVTGLSRLYEGPVLYRKSVYIPHDAEGKVLVLEFEAVNYYCKVWVNGSLVGTHEGGWDSFSFDITPYVVYGKDNLIHVAVIKQGNTFPARETTAGFLPDITYVYGGIYRSVTLHYKEVISFDAVWIEPDFKNRELCVWGHIVYRDVASRPVKKPVQLRYIVVWPDNIKKQEWTQDICLSGTENRFEFRIPVDPVIPWDCDNPNLYNCQVEVIDGPNVMDTVVKKVGIREITVEGERILLNGKPLYIRGILHWGYYPELIAPSPDRDTIIEEIDKVKRLGFNTVKHCLYIPSRDYFELADEMGILLWQEMPMWLPKVTDAFCQRVVREYESIMKQIHGHASVIIYTLGCELDKSVNRGLLENLFNLVKHYSMGALVTDNSGSGECYGGVITDYSDFYDYHFYSELQYIESLMEVFTPRYRKIKPWLYGEFCDYDTMTDTRAIIEEHGGETPWWLSKSMDRNPQYLLDLHYKDMNLPLVDQQDILQEEPYVRENLGRIRKVSFEQALLHRKFTVEATRKFPEISGYVITSLRDCSLTSSGIFDYRMRAKFTSQEMALFNAPSILCLSWDLNRAWVNGGDRPAYKDHYNYWSGDTVKANIILSHFGGKECICPRINTQVYGAKGEVLYQNSMISREVIKPGQVCEIGEILFTAPDVTRVEELCIRVTVDGGNDVSIRNEWPIWVYPRVSESNSEEILVFDPLHVFEELYDNYEVIDNYELVIPKEVRLLVTTVLNEQIKEFVEQGGRVFYIQRGSAAIPIVRCPFWRESIRIIEDHPITKRFKTGEGLGLQGFGIATDIAFRIKNIEGYDEVIPIIRRVDGRRFTTADYMLEIRKGKGVMIASTLRLEGGMGKQPTGIFNNTAGRFLFHEVLGYLLGL